MTLVALVEEVSCLRVRLVTACSSVWVLAKAVVESPTERYPLVVSHLFIAVPMMRSQIASRPALVSPIYLPPLRLALPSPAMAPASRSTLSWSGGVSAKVSSKMCGCSSARPSGSSTLSPATKTLPGCSAKLPEQPSRTVNSKKVRLLKGDLFDLGLFGLVQEMLAVTGGQLLGAGVAGEAAHADGGAQLDLAIVGAHRLP